MQRNKNCDYDDILKPDKVETLRSCSRFCRKVRVLSRKSKPWEWSIYELENNMRLWRKFKLRETVFQEKFQDPYEIKSTKELDTKNLNLEIKCIPQLFSVFFLHVVGLMLCQIVRLPKIVSMILSTIYGSL